MAHQLVPVRDSSQPGSARFAAQEQASAIGFSEGDAHRADVLQIQEAARAALLELPPLPANDFSGHVKPESPHEK